jgi:hypothetical protein
MEHLVRYILPRKIIKALSQLIKENDMTLNDYLQKLSRDKECTKLRGVYQLACFLAKIAQSQLAWEVEEYFVSPEILKPTLELSSQYFSPWWGTELDRLLLDFVPEKYWQYLIVDCGYKDNLPMLQAVDGTLYVAVEGIGWDYFDYQLYCNGLMPLEPIPGLSKIEDTVASRENLKRIKALLI